MKAFRCLGFVFVASCLSVTAIAADFDGSETLICSFARVVECVAGSECREVSNESVDAPDFVKFDFKKKRGTAISAGVESPPDDIDNILNLTNYLTAQGVQGGVEGAPNTLAWSVSISHHAGLMVFSAAGEHAAFVVFGACTAI